MKKFSVKWMAMVLAVSLLCMNAAAYAHPDPILTDSYPICIYTGDVADSYFDQSDEDYEDWYQNYIYTYGAFYRIYTQDRDDDIEGDMTDQELVAYVRENWKYLLENDMIMLGGTMPVVEAPRRSLGEIKDVEYTTITREYLIPLKDGKTAVMDTPDGYVFLGGEYDPLTHVSDGDPGYMDAVASEQSGWKAGFYMGNVCSVQRFCGDDKAGYYHINELYTWGDLVDKQKKVENLLILPIEDCRGMMATATQNWALEQAIAQSQAEGFDEQWHEWVEWNEKYGN